MSFRTEIALALLIGAVLVVAVVAGRPRRAGSPLQRDQRASTLVTGPNGSRALYDVLTRLRIPVERRRRPVFTLAKDSLRRPALLVVLDPPLDLVTAELEEVASYVRGGGAVLVAGSGGGITECFGFADVGTEDRMLPPPVAVVPPVVGWRLPAARRVLRSATPKDERDVKARFTKVSRGGECAGVPPIGRDTLLRTGDRRPVILRLRYARGGSVTLLADPAYVRNRAWRDTDAPSLIVPLLLAGGRGRVSWDEYHQGFGRSLKPQRAMLDWLLASPVGWALLQLAVVALAWVAVSAVRFGPALAVVERRRRSPLEHVEALAAGLESAAGADTAVELTIAGLRRRLSRAGGGTVSGAGLDARRWLSGLELSLPSPRGRAAVRRLSQLTTHPGGAERVLAAAQAVEDVWEELRPRTTRD